MNHAKLFDFESDFVATLRCIPMAVRFKLDQSGVKLSLRQWSRFTRADRHGLLTAPCGSVSEIEAYREALVALIALRTDEPIRMLAEEPCGLWNYPDQVPTSVTDYARSIGLAPPSGSQWRELTVLQRFVLLKLTRDNHDNINFAPAMVEFELVSMALGDAA